MIFKVKATGSFTEFACPSAHFKGIASISGHRNAGLPLA